MKRILAFLFTAALLLTAAASALAVEPDPLPPVPQAADVTAPADEPLPEPSDEPSAEPLPLVPGTYEGKDGSVLTVGEDGAASFETRVSGTINGRAMSGRLTFVGTLEADGFSFTRVKFFMLDLTEIAASLGYTDASHWEEQAAALYLEAIAETDTASGEASA